MPGHFPPSPMVKPGEMLASSYKIREQTTGEFKMVPRRCVYACMHASIDHSAPCSLCLCVLCECDVATLMRVRASQVSVFVLRCVCVYGAGCLIWTK